MFAREVERVVAEYRPETTTRDRVRAVCVRVPATQENTATPGAGSESTARDGHETKNVSGTGDMIETVEKREHTGSTGEPAPTRIVHKHQIQFVVGDEFMKKLSEVQALLSNRMPGATFEGVLLAAMNAFLDANSPAHRARRRIAREKATIRKKAVHEMPPIENVASPPSAEVAPRPAKTSRPPWRSPGRPPRRRPQHSLPAPGVRNAGPRSRHIPTAIRDTVFVRDRGRCTFVGPGGTHCNATRHLQVDHVEPFARGGTHAPSNLRLLCRAHNMLAAERIYGQDICAQYARRE